MNCDICLMCLLRTGIFYPKGASVCASSLNMTASEGFEVVNELELVDADSDGVPYESPGYFDDFRDYLSYRTPPALAIGGVVGASMGYYIGDAMALYGYTYGFGLGLVTTSFFTGVYGMKSFRKTDDPINYAVSGSLNGGIIGTATGGYKRGAKLAVAGIFGGIAAKYIGDWTYSSMRSSWISYRRLTLMESRPRILETKPKMRRPKEGEYFSPREVVTVGMFEWPTWGMATKSPDSEHFKTFPSSKDSDSESGSREKK